MRSILEIEIEDRGVIHCYDDETLLEGLSKHNINGIVYGCFGGGCGKCMIRVHKGSYEVCKKMSKIHIEKKSDEKILACCIMPKSNMKISIYKSKESQNGN